jgi:hypothetical protein
MLAVVIGSTPACKGTDEPGGGAGAGPGAAGSGSAATGASGGGGAGGTAGASGGAAGTQAGNDDDLQLADGLGREYHGIVNFVSQELVDELELYMSTSKRFTGGSDGTLETLINVFYDHYRDDYDFVFFFSDHTIDGPAAGLNGAVNNPPLLGTGRDAPGSQMRGPPNLKSAIGMEAPPPNGLPPFAHELMHYWGNDLDGRLGFGDLHQADWGAHWGLSGVNGQLGGFAPATLRCAEPVAAKPPNCTAESSGLTRYLVEPFEPASAPRDRSYAPLELYLMGLMPASEIEEPIPYFVGATFDVDNPSFAADGSLVVEATGVAEMTIADIVARHGEVPLRAAGDRHFRIAVALITATPASEELLDSLVEMASVFGGETTSDAHPEWKSFEQLTGARATLSWRLGERREPDGEYQDWVIPFYDECRPDGPACDAGLTCYGTGGFYCSVAGSGAQGDNCLRDNDCAAGLNCVPAPSQSGVSMCAPYCDHVDDAAPDACAVLCPTSFSPIFHPQTLEALAATCFGGASGACNPVAQDCPSPRVCTGIDVVGCDLPGTTAIGAECFPLGSVCVKGSTCVGIQGAQKSYCQPYCDASPTAEAQVACSTLCPGGAWPYEGYSLCIPTQ